MTHRLVERLPVDAQLYLSFVSTTCRSSIESESVNHNGRSMGTRRRRRTAGDNATAAVYLHGIESHAGWFDLSAPLLVKQDIDVFALDRRGSGLNRGLKHHPDGHANSIDEVLSDVKSLVESLRSDYERVILIGLSWGGKPALTLAIRRPDLVDGLILITPGLKALVDVPAATKLKILTQSILMPRGKTTIPIQPEMFTTTPQHLGFIKKDPLRLHQATAKFFMVSRAFESEIDATIERLSVPTLLILAGKDQIIDNESVQGLLERSASNQVSTLIYDDQTHSIQFDAPERLTTDIGLWWKPVAGQENERES